MIELIRRRDLPHWDVPCAVYFVTTCLEGSIPAQGLLDIENYRTELNRRPLPTQVTERDWTLHLWKLTFARTDNWLDNHAAVHHLADPQLAEIVVNALYFFAGQRYDLLAYVVMPSHIHWVFQPLESWVDSLGPDAAMRSPRERIIHSANRHSAKECNEARGVSGVFWQHESYDHWIRDAAELERIILYVENNPVKAGLVQSPADWPFSSARDRVQTGTLLSCPLPPRIRQVENLPPRNRRTR